MIFPLKLSKIEIYKPNNEVDITLQVMISVQCANSVSEFDD